MTKLLEVLYRTVLKTEVNKISSSSETTENFWTFVVIG